MALVLLPRFCLAETDAKAADEPIRITAERLEADENKQLVVFSGQVQARKADMVIYADKMTLFYDAGEKERIDRIEIDGQLRIVQEDRIATADHGVYHSNEGRILLSGNAEVHQGGNSIVGDEIEYYLDEARSVVKSQPDSRVNAVFSTGGSK
jgi:lipopolysaccharide export system protein LptA